MKKRHTAVAMLVLGLGLVVCARAAEPVPELWFPVGEKLTYRIYWGMFKVGITTTATGWIEEDGRTRLAIRFRTRTNRILEKLYPVDDFLEAIIDPVTFLPVRFTKRLKEGRYRADETTVFDHARGVAHWRSNMTDKKKDFAIEPDTRDVISFMYFMRSRPLKIGDTVHARVMADEKLYDLYVNIRRRENLKLPEMGRRPSVKLEPEAAFNGLFVRKGKLWMWVSDDKDRFCTKLAAKVPVASVSLWLTKVEVEPDRVVTGESEDDEELEVDDEPAS
ncbi:MAG TPA: DUF3108 domain-containing protein [Kiritimatiellia bacterium]|nr:DUF3108 domain-containing protein [Kiritimatiellia bacterium]HRZ11446.1 DUF3108 domain-containing protein [Kiritimatiellia bacterium]HSA17003.1 DUF3108 domain-containing protein [Kiritimatiellia bacterium]